MAHTSMPAIGLLEREHELALIESALAQSRRGTGRVLLIEGPAGIGKTSLLRAACVLAAEQGFAVLGAAGDELAGHLAYTAVREMLLPAVERLDERTRAEALSGAAAFAEPLLGSHGLPLVEREDASSTAYYGLYWLVANLASREPLALALDDVQWADLASLGWLSYLARRLDGLPVLVVCTLRPGDPGTEREALVVLRAQPEAAAIRPTALSRVAVEEIVHGVLPDAPDQLCRVCHESSAGNPFLLKRLVGVFDSDAASAANAIQLVRSLGPHAIVPYLVARLGRLPAGASALAQAVAVLGGRTTLGAAAALAGVADDRAAEIADALVGEQVFAPGPELAFHHPLVREAIYSDMGQHQRASAHARAARLLERLGAPADHVVAQLMAGEPAGDEWVVERLHEAAKLARRQGAPGNAVSLLERALRESPGGGHRWMVQGELGDAEAELDPAAAIARLREAQALAPSSLARAGIALRLSQTLLMAGDVPGAYEAAADVRGDLADEDSELALELDTIALFAAGCHVDVSTRETARAGHLAQSLSGATRGERAALGQVAFYAACAGVPARDVFALAERALIDGHLSLDDLAGPFTAFAPVPAFAYVDRLVRATQLSDELVDQATQRGAVASFVMACTIRAEVMFRRGELARAEADALQALEAPTQHVAPLWEAMALATLVRALVERGALERAQDALAHWQPPPAAGTSWGAVLGVARGTLALARGGPAEALLDLQAADAVMWRLGTRNPTAVPARTAAALAQHALGRTEEARALADRDLELARAAGNAIAIGAALRTAGTIAGGKPGLELLHEAVDTLAPSDASLQHAHALADLGAALRRAKHRSAARQPLREALDIAHRCGAEALAAHARLELQATGARPRKLVLTGADSLTPSELRVATMAASGLTNPEIAQALFVTRKTVEMHLGRAYQKLDIGSRTELAGALST